MIDLSLKIYKKSLCLLMASVSCITTLLACSSPSPSIDNETLKRIYASPGTGTGTGKPLNVYHLGHSLVGKDMPVMLKQLACCKHDFKSQLGWGAALESHWEPEIKINGFSEENDHANYQDVFKAIDSGNYNAFVLTESVEIKDAIKYHNSAYYLANFARYIQKNSPDTTIYLYETWHEVTDPAGWIERLDSDYQNYWLDRILYPALLLNQADVPIYIIPVGQVMSKLFRRLEQKGGVDGLGAPEDIFARNEDGSLDPIHLNDIGNYLVALVHYAVLYKKSPLGLAYKLKTADGSPATAPGEELAKLMQSVTWEVVSADFRTGLKGF